MIYMKLDDGLGAAPKTLAKEIFDDFFARFYEDIEEPPDQATKIAQFREYRKAAFAIISQFGAALDECMEREEVTITLGAPVKERN